LNRHAGDTVMRVWHGLVDLLTRDVSPWGGLASPLLCWLGAAGLVGFFCWQAARLLAGARRAGEPLARLLPRLGELAGAVEAVDLARSYDRAFIDRRPTAPPAQSEPDDLDRLRELDGEMREIDALRRPWIQFRKTLLIEHVQWFKEPRVFSTRPAGDFFTPDAVLGGRVDLAFFAQVPSLITGLGLLLTFVAICIGLSRLHAEGQSIAGIPGLINGLAGKFLTSIVGLICANVFLLVERPAVRALLDRHAEFVALIDESFPRRTAEDLLDELRRLGNQGREMRDALTSLAGAIQTLETHKSSAQAQITALVDQLGAAVTAIGGEGTGEPGPAEPWIAAPASARRPEPAPAMRRDRAAMAVTERVLS
jgi:hypothetical protein